MARRTQDWNKGLANDLKDTAFMRAFINASLDEGVPIQQVLRKLVDEATAGVKGYSRGQA